MKTDADTVAQWEGLAERYEGLRHEAVSGKDASRDDGMTLFLRRGMSAWMRAWIDLVPEDHPLPAEGGRRSCDCAGEARGEIVMLLSNMALGVI